MACLSFPPQELARERHATGEIALVDMVEFTEVALHEANQENKL